MVAEHHISDGLRRTPCAATVASSASREATMPASATPATSPSGIRDDGHADVLSVVLLAGLAVLEDLYPLGSGREFRGGQGTHVRSFGASREGCLA